MFQVQVALMDVSFLRYLHTYAVIDENLLR